MRSKAEIITALINPGIIAVVRAPSQQIVLPMAEALLEGGIRAIEVTMTTPGALQAIETLSAKLPKNAVIGVGTVLQAETVHQAVSAGAEFIVSPICRIEIAEAAAAANRPVMLGAFTPTEAQRAHESGADFVKLFPADTLGVPYIKAIRAPLPHLKLVPTGGVTIQNIAEFFRAGCPAVGVGSSLITKEVLERRDWKSLARISSEFVAAVAQK
jgi:2-dehydro-3-deoxyphosphogluconate aldolase/(4S)-4-hydroxy-2-oxoglutarate aldolase